MSAAQFDAIKRYAELTEEDTRLLCGIRGEICRSFEDIVEDFYGQILATEDLRRLLRSDAQVARLKSTFRAWLDDVFNGPHDAAYGRRRTCIGLAHVGIGLPQAYVFAAMSRIRRRLEEAIVERLAGDPARLRSVLGALSKVLDLDLALIAGSYHEAETYRDLVELAPEMIHEIDRQGRFISVNQTERSWLGLEPGRAGEARFEDFLEEPEKAAFREHLRRVFEQGHSRCELDVRSATGQRFPVEILATAVRDPITGELQSTRAYVREVSERKRAEAALRRERDVAQGYLDISGAILCSVDREGRFTLMNRRGCEVLGYQEAELLGRSFELVVPQRLRAETRERLGRALRGEGPPLGAQEGMVLTRAGEERVIEWRQSLQRDGEGAITGMLSSGLDMTERRHMERALVEQASLARLGEMAAVVAHEIKNPLAGIGGAIQVMSSQLPASSSGRLMADEILERLDALNDTVNDMLLFARPRMPRPVPVPMVSLFEDIAALLRQDPQLRRITLDTHIPDIAVPCDADLLKPALLNILLNGAQAMKGDGCLRIAVERQAPYCRIAIADTGPGIPAGLRDRIFEPFFSTKHRGTGLGLPIARRIVEAHGGRLEILCPAGGGTTVHIDLPLEPPALLPAKQPAAGEGTM